MKYIKVLSILSIFLLFSACKENSSSPSDNEDDPKPGRYIPLQIGAEWEYEITQASSNSTYTLRNIGETEKNGHTWTEQITTAANGSQSSIIRFENGKYIQFIASGTGIIVTDMNFIALDENAEIGDTWEIPHKVMFAGSSPIDAAYTMKIVEKLESYTVRGTKYEDVISVDLNLSYFPNGGTVNRINQRTYYASNVGVIKVEGFGPSTAYTQELINYTP
ncbi:MAG: hypothetical protein ACE364_08200 [Chlorobiota bacterium]